MPLAARNREWVLLTPFKTSSQRFTNTFVNYHRNLNSLDIAVNLRPIMAGHVDELGDFKLRLAVVRDPLTRWISAYRYLNMLNVGLRKPRRTPLDHRQLQFHKDFHHFIDYVASRQSTVVLLRPFDRLLGDFQPHRTFDITALDGLWPLIDPKDPDTPRREYYARAPHRTAAGPTVEVKERQLSVNARRLLSHERQAIFHWTCRR